MENGVDAGADGISIYMKDALGLESEIAFFTSEETDDNMVFNKDGITYHYLLSVHIAIDLIESEMQEENASYSDLQIAQRLLDYALRDA